MDNVFQYNFILFYYNNYNHDTPKIKYPVSQIYGASKLPEML